MFVRCYDAPGEATRTFRHHLSRTITRLLYQQLAHAHAGTYFLRNVNVRLFIRQNAPLELSKNDEQLRLSTTHPPT